MTEAITRSADLQARALRLSRAISAGNSASRDFAQVRVEDVGTVLRACLAVSELHQVEKRFQPWEGYEYSYDSEREVRTTFDDPDAELAVHVFEICRECGRVEAEANEHADEWSYRAAIWPCATAKAAWGAA